MLKRAGEIERELKGDSLQNPTRVAFGLGPMLASILLPDLLVQHASRRNGWSLHVVIQSPAVMTERLLAGEIDFYLGQEPGPGRRPARVRQELLGLAGARLWVRPEHPLASRTRVSLESIADYTLASGEAWNSTIVPLLEDERLQELLTADVQVDNYDLLVNVVQNSDAILISVFGHPQIRLVELRVGGGLPAPPSQLYVFSLSGIELAPAVAEARDELKRRYLSLTT
jgi:hypothetical protein